MRYKKGAVKMYRIYLADDETWVVIGLKKQIEKSGLPFQVIGEANNGVAAMEEILEKKPDVLISDIRMPGLNGLQLLEKLREKGLDVKVIFISGYAEFEYAQSAIRMGTFDYLLKPVEQEKLDQVLERLLGAFRSGRGGEEVSAAEPINSSMMDKIIREIQERYTENITLSGLAEAYGISTGYLSSQLKAELGLSFSKYITSKRIQKAKELLADESLSVESIAEQTGYNDYFYFIKVFKKNTGISPSKYRKNL
nr:response regulator [uncultured Blautia sp.]